MNHSSGEIEKRTISKTMKRILPFILLLYIIAYLDRVNLGYAALQMNAEPYPLKFLDCFLVFSSSVISFLKFLAT
ncbi:hypothetical protein [Peribacillus frigoritolerans]|uniref:hypothetical protein n=1 Tax=Peribacillus frigoritolerans TaxID=450367 RepID=UPI00399FED7E